MEEDPVTIRDLDERPSTLVLIMVGRLIGWVASCGVLYLAFSLYMKTYDIMDWAGIPQWAFVMTVYWLLPVLDPTDDGY